MAKITPESVAKSKQVDVLAYPCPGCDQPQVFRVVHRHTRWSEGADAAEEYTYAVCPRCAGPLILVREDYGDGFDVDSYGREYPPLNRRLLFAVPRIVRQSYDEAVKCEQTKAWTAAAVMVGRSLEAICREFDPSARSVHEGLAKMFAAGVISEELRDWGDSLRVVRNEGAHAGATSVSASDAVHALDFLQALIEILYDLRVRFAEWQEERQRRAEARQKRSSPKIVPGTTPENAT